MTRLAKSYIAQWHERWPFLTNLVAVKNKRAVTWLRFLGFRFAGTFAGQHDPSVLFTQFHRHV
jgi:hypothetical protein